MTVAGILEGIIQGMEKSIREGRNKVTGILEPDHGVNLIAENAVLTTKKVSKDALDALRHIADDWKSDRPSNYRVSVYFGVRALKQFPRVSFRNLPLDRWSCVVETLQESSLETYPALDRSLKV